MKFFVITFCLLIIPHLRYSLAQITDSLEVQDKSENTGVIDLNLYFDTRESADFTINLLANLPQRIQYFSFINLSGSTSSSEMDAYYTEQHLRWNPIEKIPLDLTQLWTSISGPSNDNLFYGIRWRWNQSPFVGRLLNKADLTFFVNFHLIGFSTTAPAVGFPQMEYFYRWDILPKKLNNRVYISGFVDQNLLWEAENGKISSWVTEHQAGIRTCKEFYLIAEYRFNEYRTIKSGWGFGFEYFIKF